MIKTTLPLLLLTLFLAPLPASAEEKANRPALTAARALELLQVVELSATGPDGQNHTLLAHPRGISIPRRDMGRIGDLVDGSDLVDGRYHTLFVTLADGYLHLDSNGTQERRSLSEEGLPSHFRIPGMVLVDGGRATPLRMIEQHGYYPYPAHFGEDDD